MFLGVENAIPNALKLGYVHLKNWENKPVLI